MIPAQLADGIDDLIHLSQRHPIHLLVQLIEICFDLFIVIGIMFVVALVEHGQDGLAISEVRWMGFDI